MGPEVGKVNGHYYMAEEPCGLFYKRARRERETFIYWFTVPKGCKQLRLSQAKTRNPEFHPGLHMGGRGTRPTFHCIPRHNSRKLVQKGSAPD